jgi:hypothetical protein
MKIAACIILALFLLAQSRAKKPDGNDTQGQDKTDSAREPQAPLTVNCNQSSGDVADRHKDETRLHATVQWSNWLLVVAAAVTAWVIWQQTVATRQSVQAIRDSVGKMVEANSINREALQAGQRAYVSFMVIGDAIQVNFVKDSAGNVTAWRLRNGTENTGNTPAWELVHRINAYWDTGELPNDFNYPDAGTQTVEYVSTLAAKARIYSPEITISQSVIKEVYEGSLHLYLYGWATYRDVFSGTPVHRTEFCHEIRIREIVGDRVSLAVSLHHQHNTQT